MPDLTRTFYWLILLACSYIASFLATRSVLHIWGKRLLDVPNDRSSHSTPTPRGGGIGFLIAFAISGVILAGVNAIAAEQILITATLGTLGAIALILLPLAIVGLMDDRQNVPAKVRYAVQLGVGLVAVWRLGAFPQPWLPTSPGGEVAAFCFTVIGFTALVNFYNFMDGLDGLVASVSAVQLGCLALYLGQPIWWLLVAALLGFLRWNWSPAKIFMGDVGSTALGASVAISLITPSSDPTRNVAALAITLPLTADAIYTLVRRLLRGENIFQAHRFHLYQRLQQSGWNHSSVAIAYLLWTLIVAVLVGKWHVIGSGIALAMSCLVIAIGEYYLHTLKQRLEQDPAG